MGGEADLAQKVLLARVLFPASFMFALLVGCDVKFEENVVFFCFLCVFKVFFFFSLFFESDSLILEVSLPFFESQSTCPLRC